jgi:hypothetical protein
VPQRNPLSAWRDVSPPAARQECRLLNIAGTATGDVPPVGSQFNFYYFGNSGFALFASAIPSPSGDVKKSFKLVTPLSGKFPA